MKPVLQDEIFFIDNREGNNLASAIATHQRQLRSQEAFLFGIDVATGFFTLPGFMQIADALDAAGGARMLLGAEQPPEATKEILKPGEPTGQEWTRRKVESALAQLDAGLSRARDELAFDDETDHATSRLLEMMGAGKLEVRQMRHRYLPQRFLLFRAADGGAFAGSANVSLQGFTDPNMLMLGHHGDPAVSKLADWFEREWNQAVHYDLAGLFGA